MKPVQTVLDRYLSGERFRREMDIAALWRNWPQLLGEQMAQMVKPLGKQGSSLVLGVEDNFLMQEMVYHREDILEQIEHYLGWQPFDKIKLQLLQDKSALDEAGPSRTGRSSDSMPIPENVGAMLDILPQDTPFARCYKAYLNMLKQRGRMEVEPEANKE